MKTKRKPKKKMPSFYELAQKFDRNWAILTERPTLTGIRRTAVSPDFSK